MNEQIQLKALADPTRNKIIELLKDSKKEMSAGEISSHFEIERGTVSYHLKSLKNAKLIKERKEGQFVLYSLSDEVREGKYPTVSDAEHGSKSIKDIVLESLSKLCEKLDCVFVIKMDSDDEGTAEIRSRNDDSVNVVHLEYFFQLRSFKIFFPYEKELQHAHIPYDDTVSFQNLLNTLEDFIKSNKKKKESEMKEWYGVAKDLKKQLVNDLNIDSTTKFTYSNEEKEKMMNYLKERTTDQKCIDFVYTQMQSFKELQPYIDDEFVQEIYYNGGAKELWITFVNGEKIQVQPFTLSVFSSSIIRSLEFKGAKTISGDLSSSDCIFQYMIFEDHKFVFSRKYHNILKIVRIDRTFSNLQETFKNDKNLDYLIKALKDRRNILIMGANNTGKTTLLKLIKNEFIDKSEKKAVIDRTGILPLDKQDLFFLREHSPTQESFLEMCALLDVKNYFIDNFEFLPLVFFETLMNHQANLFCTLETSDVSIGFHKLIKMLEEQLGFEKPLASIWAEKIFNTIVFMEKDENGTIQIKQIGIPDMISEYSVNTRSL